MAMTPYQKSMLALYMNRMINGQSRRFVPRAVDPASPAVPATKTKPPTTNTKRPSLAMARKRLAEITLIELEYGAAKKK